MGKIYVHRVKPTVNEEDVNQNNRNNQANATTEITASPKLEAIRGKIVQLQGQLNTLEQEYNNKRVNIQKQITLLNQQLVNANANPSVENESVKPNYYNHLWESVNEGEDLCNVIMNTFRNLIDVSYYPNERECMKLCRRILPVFNNNRYNDGVSHWNDIYEDLINIFTGSTSLSQRELNSVMAEFQQLLKEHPTFKYIFGI